jgi:hypothetical protein
MAVAVLKEASEITQADITKVHEYLKQRANTGKGRTVSFGDIRNLLGKELPYPSGICFSIPSTRRKKSNSAGRTFPVSWWIRMETRHISAMAARRGRCFSIRRSICPSGSGNLIWFLRPSGDDFHFNPCRALSDAMSKRPANPSAEHPRTPAVVLCRRDTD